MPRVRKWRRGTGRWSFLTRALLGLAESAGGAHGDAEKLQARHPIGRVAGGWSNVRDSWFVAGARAAHATAAAGGPATHRGDQEGIEASPCRRGGCGQKGELHPRPAQNDFKVFEDNKEQPI